LSERSPDPLANGHVVKDRELINQTLLQQA
jgi:hypothetical protein